MSERAAIRVLRRSVLILLASGICTLALYALAQSPLAAQLAVSMNFSEPLIALNDLVQGASGAARVRGGLSPGVSQVIRDTLVLAAVVTVVVVTDHVTRRRRKVRPSVARSRLP